MPDWTRQAKKDLDDLPPRIREKAVSICNALDEDITLGKKLKGKLADYRSTRLGRAHRIIYKVEDGVTIMTIRPRKDAYR